MPQWLFYAPILALWRVKLMDYKGMGKDTLSGERKGIGQVKLAAAFVTAFVLLLLGVFMESYVNPFFLQKIIRIM